MDAEIFRFIKRTKKRSEKTYDMIAENISRKYGMELTGEQIKEFVDRAKVPFGGFLTLAIQEDLKIPPLPAESYISTKGGSSDE